jgi:hypothetical protein
MTLDGIPGLGLQGTPALEPWYQGIFLFFYFYFFGVNFFWGKKWKKNCVFSLFFLSFSLSFSLSLYTQFGFFLV